MSTDVSFLSHPIEAKRLLSDAWNSFTHLQVGDGIAALTRLGGDAIGLVAVGIGGYLIYDILKNNNLPWYKKIPAGIAITAGAALAIPATVAVIAGASTLVPPFMFVASIGATARNIGVYLSERSERNKLRQEMITTKGIKDYISKAKLSQFQKETISDYIFKQQEIYLTYYRLRQSIINSSQIDVKEKAELIKSINQEIEAFSKDSNKGQSKMLILKIDHLPESVKDEIKIYQSVLNSNLVLYKDACLAFSKITLENSFKKRIHDYKFTREKVLSQDLPEEIKLKILQTIHGTKIKKDDLKLLYAQIGNHYLNTTARKQIAAQDDNFYQEILASGKTSSQAQIIKNYCESPRAIFTSLLAYKNAHIQNLRRLDPKDKRVKIFDDFMIAFMNSPKSFSTSDWSNLRNEIEDPLAPTLEGQDIFKQLSNYEKVMHDYDELKLPDDLLERISQHQKSTLAQQSNLGRQFESPKINFNLNRYNLVKRAADAAAALKDRVLAKDDDGQPAIEGVLQTIDASHKDEEGVIKENTQKLRDDFMSRYENTFDVIAKSERLHFLEASVPRRLANVFWGMAIATVSLATTVLIPAVASPAAPVAAAAITVFGAVSAVLTGLCLANSLDIIRRELLSDRKVNRTKEQVHKGIAPDMAKDKELQADYKKEHDEKQAKLAKEQEKIDVKVGRVGQMKDVRYSALYESPTHHADKVKSKVTEDEKSDKDVRKSTPSNGGSHH